MARRISGIETKASGSSYRLPRTSFFIFLAAEFSTDRLFEHFAELDELGFLIAARVALERTLAGHGFRFGAGVVAVAAHARYYSGALYALAKAAYQIDSRLALVFSHFRICSHCAKNNNRNRTLVQGFEVAGEVGEAHDGLAAVVHGAHQDGAVERLALAHDKQVRDAGRARGGKLRGEFGRVKRLEHRYLRAAQNIDDAETLYFCAQADLDKVHRGDLRRGRELKILRKHAFFAEVDACGYSSDIAARDIGAEVVVEAPAGAAEHRRVFVFEVKRKQHPRFPFITHQQVVKLVGEREPLGELEHLFKMQT